MKGPIGKRECFVIKIKSYQTGENERYFIKFSFKDQDQIYCFIGQNFEREEHNLNLFEIERFKVFELSEEEVFIIS